MINSVNISYFQRTPTAPHQLHVVQIHRIVHHLSILSRARRETNRGAQPQHIRHPICSVPLIPALPAPKRTHALRIRRRAALRIPALAVHALAADAEARLRIPAMLIGDVLLDAGLAIAGHLGAEGEELGGGLLELGVLHQALALAGAALPDAAEGEDGHGDEQHAANGGGDGDLRGRGEAVPFLRRRLAERAAVVAVEFDRRGGVEHVDAGPGAGRVAVFVLRYVPVAVGHADGLHDHREGRAAVVCHAAGPFDRAVGFFRVAAGPDAHAHVHGGLGEVVATVGVGGFERAHDLSVDVPVYLAFAPVGRVVVPCGLGVGDGVVDGAVVGGGVAFAEVVRFDVGGVAAHEFPIDFVKIVGFEHDGRDDALAAGCFHDHLDLAAEDVEVCLHCGRVASLVNCEFGSVVAVIDRSSGRIPDCGRHDGVHKVDAVVGDSEGDVGGTVGAVHGIA